MDPTERKCINKTEKKFKTLTAVLNFITTYADFTKKTQVGFSITLKSLKRCFVFNFNQFSNQVV